MKILMVTNTFTPHVGGVARSVQQFTDEYRRRGHDVIVIAPEFEGAETSTPDTIRTPALEHWNAGDFSLALPVPAWLSKKLCDFEPDIVHSHHPFLLGSTAVRLACKYDVPLIFTHHTMYERYAHYTSFNSRSFKEFLVKLAAGYCDLCDHVIAPSESIAEVIRNRGVAAPITVIPTGVVLNDFKTGDGYAFRRNQGVPENAFVVGTVGRLAPEKNMPFLCEAVKNVMQERETVHYLVVGDGPSKSGIREYFQNAGMSDRLHMTGSLEGRQLVDAYHAMDVFGFASTSETQGMVLTEAMAAGTAVVGLDAPGVREVIKDGYNGYMVENEDIALFAEALIEFIDSPEDRIEEFRRNALKTAEEFSMTRSVDRAIALYEDLLGKRYSEKTIDETYWQATSERMKAEWCLLKNFFGAIGLALWTGEGKNKHAESS